MKTTKIVRRKQAKAFFKEQHHKSEAPRWQHHMNKKNTALLKKKLDNKKKLYCYKNIKSDSLFCLPYYIKNTAKVIISRALL